MTPRKLNLLLVAVLLVNLVSVAAPASPTRAATFVVASTADSGPGSLRQALLDASDGDVIDITATGVLALTSGELPITKTLTISGPGAASLIVSGNYASRVLSITTGVAVTITGITVADGYVNNLDGGGIYNAGALMLVNSTIYNNVADNWPGSGGGIYNRGVLTLTASTVVSNTSTSGNGGGIYNSATDGDVSAALINSSILSNTSAFDGGGMYNYASGEYTLSVTLDNTIVRGNVTTNSGFGAGLDSRGDGPTVITIQIADSVIQGNIASRGGGGIHYAGYFGSTVAVTLLNSVVSDNVANDGSGGGTSDFSEGDLTILNVTNTTIRENSAAGDGGGIDNFNSIVTLVNSAIISNTADGSGGGISAGRATTITNATLSGNRAAGDGGGIYNMGTLALNYATLAHNTADSDGDDWGDGGGLYNSNAVGITATLLAQNTDASTTDVYTDCYQTMWGGETMTSGDYNLVGDQTGCGGLFAAAGDQAGDSANPIDPVLGALQDNGGQTWTHALLPGSPALDQIPAGSCVVLDDQRGVARPQPAGGNCDVGAYECVAAHTLTVAEAGVGNGTVTSAPPGINCPAGACAADFAAGTVVTLTATPGITSTFAGWSGGCSGTGTCVVTLTADTQVTATFMAVTLPLAVTLAGVGNGTVTSAPPGINCPAGACATSFVTGTVVTLAASPDITSTFAGWSANCVVVGGNCVVTMTANTLVTATFTLIPNPLFVTRAGSGSGLVASAPPGIDCGLTCSAYFAYNSVVTLTATPSAGSTFAGWSGACIGSGQCRVTMNAAQSVTATFNTVAPQRYFVYLPVIFKAPLPDLVVQNIFATGDTITVVVKNIGLAPVVNPFWVDAYIDPHPAPSGVNQMWYDGRSEQGVAWGITQAALPLLPGNVLTLTVGDQYDGGTLYSFFTGSLPVGTPLWAQVDSYNAATSYGAVLESHEAEGGDYNNILGPILSTSAATGTGPTQTTQSVVNIPRSGWEQLPVRPGR